AAPAHAPADDEATRVYGETAGGLPKRRRRQPTAAPPVDGPTAPGPRSGAPEPDTGSHRVRSAEETAKRMGAFARGTRSGRGVTQDAAPHTEEGNRQA
ncbi:ATP-binding protein, partial [Streptomyces botrytidirepellens]